MMEQEFEQRKGELQRTISTDLGSELSEKTARIKSLEAELENIKENYDKIKESVNALRQKYHMDELSGEIAEFDLKQLEDELNIKVKELEDQFKLSQEKVTKLQDRQEKSNKQIEELNSQIIKSNAVVDDLNQTIADYGRDKQAEVEKLKREFEDGKKKMMREFNIEKDNIQKDMKDDLERMANASEELAKASEERDNAVNQLEKQKDLISNMKRVFDVQPELRIFSIISDAGPTSLNNLSKAIGQGVALTRRMAMNLERQGLLKVENEIVKLP